MEKSWSMSTLKEGLAFMDGDGLSGFLQKATMSEEDMQRELEAPLIQWSIQQPL